MKVLQLFAFLLLATLSFTACDDAVEPEEELLPNLGDEIALKIGGVTQFNETDISLAFMRVKEDSRCPDGVECFWEGQGTIQLEVTDIESTVIELTTRAGHPEMASDTLAGYVYTLLELAPYPKEGEEIQAEDYEIKLKVEEL